MATASVSGLASGLDTATIIDQLMQLEAASQTRLKSRVTTEQSTLKVLQNLNTKFAALATQATDLTKAAGLDAAHRDQLERQGHRQGHRRAPPPAACQLHRRHHRPGPPARPSPPPRP